MTSNRRPSPDDSPFEMPELEELEPNLFAPLLAWFRRLIRRRHDTRGYVRLSHIATSSSNSELEPICQRCFKPMSEWHEPCLVIPDRRRVA